MLILGLLRISCAAPERHKQHDQQMTERETQRDGARDGAREEKVEGQEARREQLMGRDGVKAEPLV